VPFSSTFNEIFPTTRFITTPLEKRYCGDMAAIP
jgi:hypothetical protein